ncbi:hypothetical protein Goarm_008107 [Gossypium armourianum]|uniref:RNase H type-1 domain-containing protein n=1 Tax=Gossypium armourianum TaxID=34283 RepID=A0A7J9JNW6_9ROSI|nr:hypothetical protein [Gossypium armourianum]
MVHELYGDSVGGRIRNLPIISNGPNDRMIWFHNTHDYYTTKSAYSWLLLKQTSHELLPTNVKISFVKQNFRRECSRLIDKEYFHCIDWLEDAMRILDRKAFEDLITTLWNSWNNRNNFFFRGKEEEARIVWERVRTLNHDFCIHNIVNKPIILVTPIVQKWEKLPNGFVKINVDATVLNNKTGFGVIIRDCDGFVIGGGGGGFKDDFMTTEWAELYAFEEGINLAHSFNVENAIFETNCTNIVNRIKKRKEDHVTIIGHRTKEIHKSMELFTKVEVKWINRSCNKVADLICKLALSNCNMFFGMDYLRDIHDIVIRDSI